jgi:hypothetical protein
MENLDFEEQQLLEQLNIVRQKKEQQKYQINLKAVLMDKQRELTELEDIIKEKKIIYFQLQNEIPELENTKVDLKNEIRELQKQLIVDNKPEPVVETEPIVEPEPEPIVEEQSNLDNIINAKRLSHSQLDKMRFWDNVYNQKIQMNQIQVGDVVYLNRNRYAGEKGFIAYITRKTDKTLFYKYIKKDESNKILHYDWIHNGYRERSYDYYFVDLQNINNYIDGCECKVSIKNSHTLKAIQNFVIVDEFDWGA